LCSSSSWPSSSPTLGGVGTSTTHSLSTDSVKSVAENGYEKVGGNKENTGQQSSQGKGKKKKKKRERETKT
jgi:hypothetical protein